MGYRVLAQIVDDDQGMLAVVAKIFGHREAGEWGNPLQPG